MTAQNGRMTSTGIIHRGMPAVARSVTCERVHEGGGARVHLLAGTTSWFGWKVHIGSFYPVFSVAFFVSLAITVVGTAIIWRVGQRRPPGTPLTWGEAMAGAVFVFA